MRTAAICPTCATYENAVCVIYDGPTLSNISVPPSTNLQVALGNIDSTVEDLQSQIDYLSTNPINLTTLGSSGPAEFDGNVLNIPIYAPTLQEVLTNGNTGETWINLDGSNSDVAFSAYTTSSQVTLLADANGYPYLNITDNVTKSTDIFKDSIRFTNITDTYSISLVSPNTLTATQNIDIPDASGTMALTSDITLQNATSGTNKNLTNGINLQGTNAGDSNTGSVNINAFGTNAASGNSGYNVNAFGNGAGQSNTFNNVNLFGSSATATTDDQVVFSKNGGAQLARIGYGGITADRLYTLPDKNGTLATTDDIPGYKVFSAIITQNGVSGLTITELKNTIGTITVSSYGTNPYYYYLVSSGLFTANKTMVIHGDSALSGADKLVRIYQGTTSTVEVYGYIAGVMNHTAIQSVSLEIRVYP